MPPRLVELEYDPPETVRAVVVDGQQRIELVSDFALGERYAALSNLHIYGGRPNSLGISGLRGLIRWAMEELDVDELRIEGATRTSGASPGRRPAALVFRRTDLTDPAP
jgi:hypothetical protein